MPTFAEIGSPIALTATLASVTTLLLLLIGTPMAWWLARTRVGWREPVAALVAMPLVLPPTVIGFYLLILLGPSGPGGALASRAFDAWLQHVLLELKPEDREQAMLHWSEAPSARVAHPREDHLVPLWMAMGAAEHEATACVYHEDSFFGALTVSSFRFGDAAATTERAA